MTNILLLPQLSASIVIAADADWRQAFAFVNGSNAPIDITGIAFIMQIRPAVGSPTIIASLSTTAATLVNGGATGVLSAVLLAAETKLLAPYAGTTAVADLLAEADGAVVNLALTPLNVAIELGVTWP